MCKGNQLFFDTGYLCVSHPPHGSDATHAVAELSDAENLAQYDNMEPCVYISPGNRPVPMFKFQPTPFHSLFLQFSRLPIDVLPVLTGGASGISMYSTIQYNTYNLVAKVVTKWTPMLYMTCIDFLCILLMEFFFRRDKIRSRVCRLMSCRSSLVEHLAYPCITEIP